nr:uncharacterized protein LOC124492429 isoform X2 [Dermatophagoides farinae]
MSTNLIINTTAASIDQMNEDGTLEWIMSKIDQFPIKLSFIFACAMVLGSVVPYIPQYFTIKQTQNTEGFSLYVCLTLLIANILRIMFWFGKHFETALLIQSIVMILAMFFLLELCVRVRNSNLIIQQKRRYFSENTMLTKSTDDTPPSLKRSRSLDDCHNNNNNNNYLKKNSTSGIICLMKSSISQTLPKNYHPQQLKENDHTTIEMDNNINNQHLMKNQLIESASPNLRRSSLSSTTTATTNVKNTHQQKNSQISSHQLMNLSPKQTIVSSCDVGGGGGGSSTTHATTTIHLELDDGSRLSSNQIIDSKKKKSSQQLQSIEQQKQQQRENEMIIVNEKGDTKLVSSNGPLKQLLINDDMMMIDDKNKKNGNEDNDFKRKRFIDFDLRYFWEWTDFMSYLECMAVFTLGAGLLFYFFIGVPLIVEGYGLVALVTESLLASPQFFRNLKVKSVEGMSKLMVFTWFLGDLYKTIYFFVRQAPFQFLLCGCTQITFDSLIFLQILCYKKASYRKIPKSRLKHLENRARKRFKENIRSKQMLNLLTTMSNADSNCPNPIVSTSVHHPQPLSKLNTSESLEPISPKDSNSLNDNVMDPLDLIELNGYENKGATFDSRDVKYADDDDDDDFENINIEDGNEELTAITQNNHE